MTKGALKNPSAPTADAVRGLSPPLQAATRRPFPLCMTESLLHVAQYHEDIPVIDLHYFSNIQSALDELETHLFLFSSEHTYCRIIHGIGSGAMAQAVHDVLKKNPLVLEWMEEETGGSCIVRF